MNKFKKGDQVKLTVNTYANHLDWLGEIVSYDKVKSDNAVDRVYNVLWIYIGLEERDLRYSTKELFRVSYNERDLELVK